MSRARMTKREEQGSNLAGNMDKTRWITTLLMQHLCQMIDSLKSVTCRIPVKIVRQLESNPGAHAL
ncbi:MAG: hypothetical protein K2Q19_02510, partial [Rhodocyclaceae bacterium]|nr:hypothetical protein [Rhodocyclaceae bacterium]